MGKATKPKNPMLDNYSTCSSRLQQIVDGIRSVKRVALDVTADKHLGRFVAHPRAFIKTKFHSLG